MVSEGCGDADSSGQAMAADRGVAQRGHHGGAVPGVELVTVLVEGHIPDPVQPVLDTPMALDEVDEVSGAGLAGIEGGDQVERSCGRRWCEYGATVRPDGPPASRSSQGPDRP